MDVWLKKTVRFEGKIYKAGEIVCNVGRSFREYLLALKKRLGWEICVFGDAEELEKLRRDEEESKQEVIDE